MPLALDAVGAPSGMESAGAQAIKPMAKPQ